MLKLEQLADSLVRQGVVATRPEALAILQSLLDMQYTITPVTEETATDDGEYRAALARLQEAGTWSLRRLRLFFEQRNTWLWDRHPELYLLTGKTVLLHGEPLLAYDIFSVGLSGMGMGKDICLDQLKKTQAAVAVELIRRQAAALAQSGAPSSAEHLLKQLVAHNVVDSETMGLLGRVYKDMAFALPKKKSFYLQQAFTIYFQAYARAARNRDQEGAYYNGINAATLAFLRGDREQARKIAADVERLCRSLRRQSEESGDSFWLDATMGEAALLQGDLDRAEKYYELACEKAGKDLTALVTIVKQARLIIVHSDIDQTVKRAPSCILPSIIVFSGHMIDTLNRKQARFPLSRQGEIKEKIRLEIQRLGGGIGYASAAAGSDILFLESMIETGGKIHIVLPVDMDNFKEQSVMTAGHDWENRFDTVVHRAESLTILDTFNPLNFENSLEFANMYLFGISRIRAEQMETDLRPLAVLQNNDRGGRGGTASMVRLWQDQQIEYSLISLQDNAAQTCSPLPLFATPLPRACSCSQKAEHHTCLPMLFADVKGYSLLSEDEAVCFSASFLARVAKILQQFDKQILSKRTAGDGLFLVFHDLKSAIEVARNLQNMINSRDWQLDDLPANLQMRISLDAGPCYSYIDPVMDKLEFCGNYVVRAARLEPITPPGHIYASDTFVALCRAEGLGRGSFSYAGRVVLPKKFGTLAVYHVRL